MLFNYLYRKLPPPTQSHENNSDWLLAENNLPTSVPSSPTTHSSRLRNLEATLVRKLEKKKRKVEKIKFFVKSRVSTRGAYFHSAAHRDCRALIVHTFSLIALLSFFS